MQEQLGVFWGVDVALDHARLARAACERGLLVFVLNPGDVRHYARSVGPGADHLGAGAGSAQRGAALISVFERLGPCSADAVIAMTGFDPRPMDSGRKTGARRLSKRGPAELRRLLYVAAMSAARTSSWKPFYLAQRAKGLPTTAALVVLARKLVRVAFSLFKQQKLFDPLRHQTSSGT